MNQNIKKYKPAVNKIVLYILAGLTWNIVGIMLMKMAYKWLFFGDIIPRNRLMALLIGVFSGILIAMLGFGKIADKNILRIKKMEGKRCIFSFIAWKSYFLIIFMIILGISLRHSSIPKLYLAILYIGIGLGLFLAGFKYFKAGVFPTQLE